ncbi:uncharacterized protein I303_108285 [Kwoniella dejecticola CBS 10117]|uniref:Uncharacterized protein n=1 Tax=Kwoniella dejecticola CBS 10117 TaxID=1296121 RepID=A0A1A5ZXT6_9TREE|nr:uncharacterized protein I303_07388 [Kwoniella dejecticola CBS 10117]OBR82626.1 hypothetical protein I303_07388 [Kwoniella dejecticola CBS 10117]
MPPKSTAQLSPTALLSLPDWLKVLTARGVDMRVAMGLAAKIYKSHGTIERLSELTPQKIAGLVEDKEARKIVSNAVRGLANGEAVSKKRGRDSDLLEPLAKRKADEDNVPLDIDFHPILDVEQLLPLTLTTNRAPVSTAWAYTISRRLGFDVAESLSLAHVYVHISSLKHALMLGHILNETETREAKEEIEDLPGGEVNLPSNVRRQDKAKTKKPFGRRYVEDEGKVIKESSQPWVGIMRAKPIIERPDGTIRAIQKGVPVGPGQGYLYITRTFKDYTPHVMGALKLVADSYEPEELNRIAGHLYNDFKPDVVEWGQRGTLELAKILDTVKSPIDVPVEEEEEDVEDYPVKSDQIDSSPIPQPKEESPLSPIPETKPLAEAVNEKKPKIGLSVEQYEDLLDSDGPGGFLEGGDIYGAEYQAA